MFADSRLMNVRMLNVHRRFDRYDDAIDLRSVSESSRKALEKEWITCPRCKNIRLKPDYLGKNERGFISIWWTCERFTVCNFPLDMPSNIFHVQQSPAQAKMGYYPLPNIRQLPERYRYMYPLTFHTGKYASRTPEPTTFDSSGSSGSNDRSDCITESDNSIESKRAENSLNDLQNKKHVNTEVSTSDNSAPSTSGFCEESVISVTKDGDRDTDLDQDIDFDIGFVTQRNPIRTIKRKGVPVRSYTKLIDNLMKETEFCTEILNMEETQLLHSLSSILEQQKLGEHRVSFTTRTRNATYQLDDLEWAFRQLHEKVDWSEARNRFTTATQNFDQSIACKQVRSGRELLDVVGVQMVGEPIDLEKIKEEKRKNLEIRIKKVMQKINNINREECRLAAKRRKLASEEAKKEKNMKKTAVIVESARARIMNKIKNKTFAIRTCPITPQPDSFEQPVQFDISAPDPVSWISHPDFASSHSSSPLRNDEFGSLNLDGLLDDDSYERVQTNNSNANQEIDFGDPFESDQLESQSNNLNFDFENTSLFDEHTFNTDNFGF